MRPTPSRPLDFEPIVLTVPFNFEVAQRLYPAILGFIGLLEVFRLVISADADEKKVVGSSIDQYVFASHSWQLA
jgi:hypothetical protein